LARRHSILAVVTASYGASVTVTGTVHLDSRQGGGAGPAAAKGLVLRSGTHAIESGEVGRFSLKFSKRLEALLRRMPPRETVNVTTKAFATGLNGERDYDVDGVRLKGRGPARRSGRSPTWAPATPGPAPPRWYPPRVGSPPARHVLSTARKARA
jgi:hypothetical protein